jgi:hypothetical protein
MQYHSLSESQGGGMMAKLQSSVSLLAILCLSAILIPATSLSDPGPMVVFGGSAHLQDSPDTDIRMVSETVRIILHPDNYTVEASFEFFNDGKTAMVTVGFPKMPMMGDYRDDLYNFQTWVNGRLVEAKEVPGIACCEKRQYGPAKPSNQEKGRLETSNESDWDAKWMVNKVNFPAKAKTVSMWVFPMLLTIAMARVNPGKVRLEKLPLSFNPLRVIG